MKKSESKMGMEKCLLAAVHHMATESLSPDRFTALEDIIEELYDTRRLGDCDLTAYKI